MRETKFKLDQVVGYLIPIADGQNPKPAIAQRVLYVPEIRHWWQEGHIYIEKRKQVVVSLKILFICKIKCSLRSIVGECWNISTLDILADGQTVFLSKNGVHRRPNEWHSIVFLPFRKDTVEVVTFPNSGCLRTRVYIVYTCVKSHSYFKADQTTTTGRVMFAIAICNGKTFGGQIWSFPFNRPKTHVAIQPNDNEAAWNCWRKSV